MESIRIMRPGDRLLVSVPVTASHESTNRMAKKLRERFPNNEVTVMACDGIVIATDDRTTVYSSFVRSPSRTLWHGVRDDGRTGCGMMVMPTDVTGDPEGQPFCSRCALYESKRS